MYPSVAFLRCFDSDFSGKPAAFSALLGLGGALRVTLATSTRGESRFCSQETSSVNL